MDRRKQKRQYDTITIRYRKDEDILYTVGDVINLTNRGFCLLLPIDLETNEDFQFEVFTGGNSIKGTAHVVWMDEGHVRAGCSYDSIESCRYNG